MQFADIIGRKKQITQLKEMVGHNRLPHSLLLLGKEGSGALKIAIAFAQYILCEKNGGSGSSMPSLFGEAAEPDEKVSVRDDSCGHCSSCVKVDKLIHPDLHFSYPVLKRDARHDRVISTDYIQEWRQFVFENPYGNVTDWLNFLRNSPTAKIESPQNKQGNISAQECEDILHKLSLKPFEGEYKILILWMPEFLGKDGNRLLKLIEEPPAGTVFIFVAEDENLILPTILSRTLLLKIPLPENEEVASYLAKEFPDESNINSVVSIAEGNIREALRLIQAKEENWERTIRDWLNLIVKNSVELQSKWIDEINQLGREKQKQLLLYFIHLIQLSVKAGILPPEDVPAMEESEKEFAHTLGKMCGIEILEEMAKELNDAIYFIERNANSKMLFHALTIRLRYLIKEKCLILVQ